MEAQVNYVWFEIQVGPKKDIVGELASAVRNSKHEVINLSEYMLIIFNCIMSFFRRSYISGFIIPSSSGLIRFMKVIVIMISKEEAMRLLKYVYVKGNLIIIQYQKLHINKVC